MSSGKDLHQIVDDALAAVPFGTVSLTLKKAHDNVTTVDITKVNRRKVEGNAQALTLIGSMLKLLGEAGETGNFTFTIAMSKGTSSEVMVQDFQRDNLNFDTGQYS